MKKIEKSDLKTWADRYESKGNFPLLISKLVFATAPLSARLDIPSGSSSFLGGWDGVVISDIAQSYIPQGTSLWEIGTDLKITDKAEREYIKRTNNPIGYNPAECTFIFVTPRVWGKKKDWMKTKLAEGKWKNVIVYDAVELEQWLETCKPVATWLSPQVDRLPHEGVLDPEQFWVEWSLGPVCQLTPETITSGRENEMEALHSFLKGSPGLKAVKATTKNEAIAFIIAMAKQLPHLENLLFFSKTLLVDTESSYRTTHLNSRFPTNLIPKFENTLPLYAAVSSGHHVIVPLGGDEDINQDVITLPTIRKDGQIEGLVKSGLNRDKAEQFSKEAGRDITILRRLLKFPHNKTTWFANENLMEIVPALLIGRWNNNSKGDRQILEQLSGLPFEEYLVILEKWRDMEESPILEIGETWRLTSPLDLWDLLSATLNKKDFDKLSTVFLTVFKRNEEQEQDDPEAEKVYLFRKPDKYSAWAREGLTQSMIMIAHYGVKLDLKIKNPQQWVDVVVEQLLENASTDLWVSLNTFLPLLSEASPDSFISSIFSSLNNPEQPIMGMFSGDNGLFGSSSNHTGLLWALEGLAWLPEYLYDATVILLRLAEKDPGGNLANRPCNSLAEIYKPWFYQTLASFDDRMDALSKSVAQVNKPGWELLMRMLPSHHGVASPTHKMRWRLFEQNTDLSYTYPEIYKTHTYVVGLIIEHFDNTEQRLIDLLDHITSFHSMADIETLLSFIEKNYVNIDGQKLGARSKLRKIITRHRSHPDTDWSLPEEILERFDTLYKQLEPKDIELRYKWLFDDHYVELPERKMDDSDDSPRHEREYNKIKAERKRALAEILAEIGLEKTLGFAKTVGHPHSVGQTLAELLDNENQYKVVASTLKKSNPNLALVQSFIACKEDAAGLDWALHFFETMQKDGLEISQLSFLLVPLRQTGALWDFIDGLDNQIRDAYWLNVEPRFYNVTTDEKIRGIDYLLYYKRFRTAIDKAYMLHDDLPVEQIAKVLEISATQEGIEKGPFREYEISTLFEELDKHDYDHAAIAKLEWLYLPVIGSYGTKYKPKHLHRELANDPEFFVQILKWVYKPNNDSITEAERENVSAEIQQNYAVQGYRLLDKFRMIPGMDDQNKIDGIVLNQWTDKVRAAAKEADRLDAADRAIGKLFAQYPENIGKIWPPDEISAIIENINSKSMKSSFSMETTNKRGFTSRGPYEGGEIERSNAAYFKKLSEAHRLKHRNISKIFKDIAAKYLLQAKEEDEQAKRDSLDY